MICLSTTPGFSATKCSNLLHGTVQEPEAVFKDVVYRMRIIRPNNAILSAKVNHVVDNEPQANKKPVTVTAKVKLLRLDRTKVPDIQ